MYGTRFGYALVLLTLAELSFGGSTVFASSTEAATQGVPASGMRISDVVPGSRYAELGLKHGDVIVSVNGIELADTKMAVQAFNALRDASSVVMKVNRAGKIIVIQKSPPR